MSRWMIRFALRNVLRHKARTATTLGAVIFGVIALILSRGFVDDTFVQLAEALIHSRTGHLQIARTGYFEHGAQQPDKYVLTAAEAELPVIARHAEISEVSARLRFSGLLNNGSADHSVIGEGVEPEKEARLGTFLQIAQGRALHAGDRYHVLLGHGVAQALRLRPGDHALLLSTSASGPVATLDLDVVGTFQTFSKEYDDRAIKLPLAAARELLDTDGANTLVIALKRTEDTRRVANALASELGPLQLEVRTWEELNDFYPKTVALYERLFGGLQFIILLMVLLSVVNAVNMSVFERTAEFGTARALGYRARQVVVLIFTETVLTGLVGGLLGVALGTALGLAISSIGIPMPPPPNADLPYIGHIRLTALGTLTSFGVGFAGCVAAAVVPAFGIARMHIVDALRTSV